MSFSGWFFSIWFQNLKHPRFQLLSLLKAVVIRMGLEDFRFLSNLVFFDKFGLISMSNNVLPNFKYYF